VTHATALTTVSPFIGVVATDNRLVAASKGLVRSGIAAEDFAVLVDKTADFMDKVPRGAVARLKEPEREASQKLSLVDINVNRLRGRRHLPVTVDSV
jgi:hypothetical protein